ncbi:MAG TPA: hypothetical protein VF551_01595, partial [Chthoniobacterales bacterium]
MSATPAVVVYDAATGSLEVAGLTVVDRLVVTAHRAGCAPIYVVCETQPTLARANALSIPLRFVAELPADLERALLISGSALVDVDDVARVIATGGTLIARDGTSLPLAMLGNPEPVIASEVAV